MTQIFLQTVQRQLEIPAPGAGPASSSRSLSQMGSEARSPSDFPGGERGGFQQLRSNQRKISLLGTWEVGKLRPEWGSNGSKLHRKSEAEAAPSGTMNSFWQDLL